MQKKKSKGPYFVGVKTEMENGPCFFDGESEVVSESHAWKYNTLKEAKAGLRKFRDLCSSGYHLGIADAAIVVPADDN